MVAIRKASPAELERVAAFYRENDYGPAISPTDVILVAEDEDALCGAVRIREEHGVLILRGMRVRKDVRRQGVGTALLQATEPVIGERGCFCIPHRYLRAFYGRVGFVEIEPARVPPFLRERCARYRHEYDLDVVALFRPPSPSAHQTNKPA